MLRASLDGESLSDLAALARDGDPVYVEALMGRIRLLAVRYARAKLGRYQLEDVAQDVAQEVCMAVLTALPTYGDRGVPFEAFVRGIAAHKIADAQRGHLRGPMPVPELPDEADSRPGPESLAVVRDQAHLVVGLLADLPEAQREILTLRVAVGMSTDETAAALGMTTGAVRVAQHRALAKLRKAIAAIEEGGVA